MADKWNDWYKDLTSNDLGEFRYGNTVTYEKGYTFLKSCDKIEDWDVGQVDLKLFLSMIIL